jgi:ubiquinone biosynthesis monooxygenase Coq6
MGLELLNEFDSIKAALMMTAGSSPRNRTNGTVYGDLGTTAFNLAAKGVEGLTTTAGAVQALQNLIRNASFGQGRK